VVFYIVLIGLSRRQAQKSLEHVFWFRASGVGANGFQVVSAAARTKRLGLDVAIAPKEVAIDRDVAVFLPILDAPLLFGGFDLGDLLDADLLARLVPGFHERRQGDGKNDPDNANDNQDLYESEPSSLLTGRE
jgi:hypothetical protein